MLGELKPKGPKGRLREGQVFAYVGLPQNLKDLKDLKDQSTCTGGPKGPKGPTRSETPSRRHLVDTLHSTWKTLSADPDHSGSLGGD